MNIITKSDIKKFVRLFKIGVKKGFRKELKTYSSADMVDGTNVPKHYYVSIEFRFRVEPEHVEQLIADDSIDNEIEEAFGE